MESISLAEWIWELQRNQEALSARTFCMGLTWTIRGKGIDFRFPAHEKVGETDRTDDFGNVKLIFSLEMIPHEVGRCMRKRFQCQKPQ